MDQQFSLRWNNYHSQIIGAFGSFRHDEDMVDVTLSCEKKIIKAHKMLLSACSPYFRNIFKENPSPHPVIVFQNVNFADLKAIVDFIYRGEVNVLQDQLESFLSTAELMEVKGLTDGPDKENDTSGVGTQMDTEDNAEERVLKKNIMRRSQQQVSISPMSSRSSSPPAKKRKETREKPPEKNAAVAEVTSVPVVPKIEVEDLTYDEDEDVSLSEPPKADMLQPARKKAIEESTTGFATESFATSISTEDIGQMLHLDPGTSVGQESMQEEVIELVAVEAIEDKNEDEVPDKPVVEEEGSRKHEVDFTEDKPLEPKTAEFPLKKRKISPENENILDKEDDDSIKEKAMPATVPVTAAKEDVPVAKPVVKSKVHIPKSLTVTTVQAAVQELFDFPTETENLLESQAVQEEDYVAFRSEDATTPVHEEPIMNSDHQQPLFYEDAPMTGQIPQGEPGIAEEAPVLDNERTEPEIPVEEEVKEPEFDYYGCEVCKVEAKPVDNKFTFTHKCPICPCACFCGHLLKEHMRTIHGWFNVQRRFAHY